MAKPRKRTAQLSVWSNDDAAVAAFLNGVSLLAEATFGSSNHELVFAGITAKAMNQSAENAPGWISKRVKGRMRMVSR